MKSVILIFFTAILFFSCAKKMTPASQPIAVNEIKPPPETPKEVAVKMESPQVLAGKEIYVAKCARCHGLKKPEDYTVAEWIPIMDRMAPKSNLSGTEKDNVTAYVNFHAKQGN